MRYPTHARGYFSLLKRLSDVRARHISFQLSLLDENLFWKRARIGFMIPRWTCDLKRGQPAKWLSQLDICHW